MLSYHIKFRSGRPPVVGVDVHLLPDDADDVPLQVLGVTNICSNIVIYIYI